MKVFCYICNDELNLSNESIEHIIPNCIGGRLKSRKLICKNCNSRTGESLEAEIGKQMHFIANLLMIKRERGEVPALKLRNDDTGEEILVNGGKPKFIKPTIKMIEDGKFSISARDTKQAREILNSFKRKHPDAEIDIDYHLKNYAVKSQYLNDMYGTSMNFGGQVMFKAMTKIAINYYLHCGFDKAKFEKILLHFSETLPFQPRNISNYYYTNEIIIPKSNNDVLHSVILVGNKKEGILYSYIELFNFFRCIVVLSVDYNGDDLKSEYYYDVLECKEVKKSCNLNLSKLQILDSLSTESNLYYHNMAGLNRELENIIGFAMERQRQELQSELVEKTIKDVFGQKKYEKEAYITQEMIKELADKLSWEVVKFFFRINEP